jgi:predicted transcriptional regulator
MAMQLMETPAIERSLREFAATLTEKDRRRFAAVEAKQRGHGGIRYIARVIGCSEKTIERGLAELENLADDPAAGRIRKPGAGRKKRLNRNLTKKKT